MTTTINAKALNEIAKAKNEADKAAHITNLEKYVESTILPNCEAKAKAGYYSHREPLTGLSGEDMVIIRKILEKLDFKTTTTACCELVIYW